MNRESRSSSSRRDFSRRNLLRAAGIAMALPLLEAMHPAIVKAAQTTATATPRRMLAICNNLGVLPEMFFPKDAGKNYALSPYLQILKEHRDDFTVFSG